MSVSWLRWRRERVSLQPSRRPTHPVSFPVCRGSLSVRSPLLHLGVPGASCCPGSACWWAPACPRGPAGRGFSGPWGRGLQSLLGRPTHRSSAHPSCAPPPALPHPTPSAFPLFPVTCFSCFGHADLRPPSGLRTLASVLCRSYSGSPPPRHLPRLKGHPSICVRRPLSPPDLCPGGRELHRPRPARGSGPGFTFRELCCREFLVPQGRSLRNRPTA